jgi:hypothetical protein
MNQNQCIAVQVCPVPVVGNNDGIVLKFTRAQANSMSADSTCAVINICDAGLVQHISANMQASPQGAAQPVQLGAPSSTRSSVPINTPFPLSSTQSGCGNSKMFPCELYSAPSATICPGYTINTKINQLDLTGTAECIVTPPSSSVTQCNETERLLKRETQFVCVPKNAI